jgi:hypothetical protein
MAISRRDFGRLAALGVPAACLQRWSVRSIRTHFASRVTARLRREPSGNAKPFRSFKETRCD